MLIRCDGSDIKVWRKQRDTDAEMALILETNACDVLTTICLDFWPVGNADFAFDNVRILADNLNTTTTYSYDNANVEIVGH